MKLFKLKPDKSTIVAFSMGISIIIVGIMYCTVFYITQDIFIIFPFFWGIGAIWDVLVNSTAGKALQNETTFIVAICLLCAMVIFALILEKGNLYGRKKKNKK
jgi:hypothetical protein